MNREQKPPVLRRLLHRLKAFIAHLYVRNPPWPAGRMRKSASNGDRPRWRRWQQANARRQRQMSAIKRLGGGKIHPNSTGLPMRVVR